MITVSQAFRRELENDNRRFVPRLEIRLANGNQLTIENDQIMQGGFRLEDGISRNNNFDIGGVVINKLVVSINNMYEDFQDIIFEDAIVTPFVGLELGPPENRMEWVRRGVFTVDEPKHNGDIITLECLDNMVQFDRPFTDVNINFPATILQIVQAMCMACGVGLATTNFLMSNFTIDRPPTNIDTLSCREALSFLCQMGGTFARFNNMGNLTIRSVPHVGSGAFPAFSIQTIKTQQIHTEDIQITGIGIADNGDNEQNESRTVLFGGEGYVLDLGQNRFVHPNRLDEVASNYWRLLGSTFRPMRVAGLADPSIEAGAIFDVVDTREGRNQATRTYRGFLTNTTFVLGGNQTFSCDAQTPRRNSATRFNGNQQVLSAVRSIVRPIPNWIQETQLAVDRAWEAAQEAQRRGDLAYESGRIAQEAAEQARIAGENAHNLANQAQLDAQTATSQANMGVSLANAALVDASSAFNRANQAFDRANIAIGYSDLANSVAGEAFNRSIQGAEIHYAVSTSGTTPPTTGWQTTIPHVPDDQFLWTRTRFVLQDGSNVVTAFSVSHQGRPGQGGIDAPRVVSVRMQYFLSTSNTELAGGTWSDTIPTWVSGRYFWERVVMTLDDGTVINSTPVLSAGLNQALVTAFEARNANEVLSSRFEQHATTINMMVERQGRAINDSVGASVSITWERGSLGDTTGNPLAHATRSRSSFISVRGGERYLPQTFDGRQAWATNDGTVEVFWYRADRTFINRHWLHPFETRPAPDDACWARLRLNVFREISDIDVYLLATNVNRGFINLNNVQNLVQINMTADSLRLQVERSMGDIASNRSDISQIRMNADSLLLQVQSNTNKIGAPFVVQRWETGNIDVDTGENIASNTAVRTPENIPVVAGTRYIAQMPDGTTVGDHRFWFYNTQGGLVSSVGFGSASTASALAPSGASSMRVRVSGLGAVALRPNEFRGNVFRSATRQDFTQTITAHSAILMQRDFINMRVAHVVDGVNTEMSSLILLHNALRLQVERNETDIARIQMDADTLSLRVQSNTNAIGAPFVVERWVAGDLDFSIGAELSSTTALRTGFIRVTPGSRYVAQFPNGTNIGTHHYHFFNASNVQIGSRVAGTATGSTLVPANAVTMRVRVTVETGWTLQPNNFTGNVFRMATRVNLLNNPTIYSSILMQRDFINFRVQNIDGLINQINISTEGILIAGNRIHITGQTTIANAVIATAHIRDLAVTTAKIANAAITRTKIGLAEIDTSHIRELNVHTAWIADGAITRAKIGNAAVGSAQIGNAQILDAHIHSLNADKIDAGTIWGINIHGGVITQQNINNLGTLLTIQHGRIEATHHGARVSWIAFNDGAVNVGRANSITIGTIGSNDIFLRANNNLYIGQRSSPTGVNTFRGRSGSFQYLDGNGMLRTLSFVNGILV